MEAAKSKDVAEQTVLCLQALLDACSCGRDETLPFIERICPLLDLPSDSVSEEVMGSVRQNASLGFDLMQEACVPVNSQFPCFGSDAYM